MTLVTGNIQKGARLKLKKFNLHKYFSCGGYGDSAASRKKIVEHAIFTSEKFFNKKFLKQNIFLFGDTKADMQSAKQNNIKPVLIDPNNKYKKNALEWGAEYYGNFKNINNLLEKIGNPTLNNTVF